MRHHFHTLDVFTDRGFAGNPLAVFPDAAAVPEAAMPLIARELNLSETVFVLPATGGGACRLRIFTPTREMPFAGHPTIGTAVLLAHLGRLPNDASILEEGVGPVPVHVRRGFAQLTAARLPEIGPPPPPRAALATILGLAPDDIVEGDVAPAVVSCGVAILFVPLVDRRAVARARLDAHLARPLLAPGGTGEVYVYARDPERPGSDLRARLFAPELGIGEDPATGAAATTLAGYLATRLPQPDGQFRWTIEQGFEMGRPSLLFSEADKSQGRVTATRVGGHAVRMSEGDFDIP